MSAATREPEYAAWSALSSDRPPGLVTARELSIEAGVTEAAIYARIKKARRDGLLSPAFIDPRERMLFRREDAERMMKLYGKPSGRAPVPGGQQLSDAVRAALPSNPKFTPVALGPAKTSPPPIPVTARGDPPRGPLLAPQKPKAPMPERRPVHAIDEPELPRSKVTAAGLSGMWEKLSRDRAALMADRERIDAEIDAKIGEVDQNLAAVRTVCRLAGVELPAEVPAGG